MLLHLSQRYPQAGTAETMREAEIRSRHQIGFHCDPLALVIADLLAGCTDREDPLQPGYLSVQLLDPICTPQSSGQVQLVHWLEHEVVGSGIQACSVILF